MKWVDKLEKKYGNLAVKNLMLYIIFLTAAVYILTVSDPSGRLLSRLTLNPALVRKGEIWRLITYIFIPPTFSPVFLFIALYFYYMIGTALESYWGSFRFNIYYLVGVIATTVIAFFSGGIGTVTYINLTLFLAFARIYPEFEVLIFFILPVKVKYLAWLNWAYFAYTIMAYPLINKITAVAALSNFFLFFGRELFNDLKRQKKVYKNKQRFRVVKGNLDETIHRCTICGITERDDPKMEFRYCSKCEGDYEYCSEHLQTHQHKKNR